MNFKKKKKTLWKGRGKREERYVKKNLRKQMHLFYNLICNLINKMTKMNKPASG